MNIKSTIIVLTAALMSLLFSEAAPVIAASQYAPMIRMRVDADIAVAGDTLTLENLGSIIGPRAWRVRLGRISLMPAPAKGETRALTGAQLTDMIRKTPGVPAGIVLDIPDQIKIGRTVQRLPDDRLASLLKGKLGDCNDTSECRLRRFRVRGKTLYPLGTIQLNPLKDLSNDDGRGRVTLPVQVSVDGKNCGRIILSAWVDRFATVVSLCRDTLQGTVLTEKDLCPAPMNLSKVPRDVLKDVDTALGKQLRRNLRGGSCLRDAELETPPLVDAGDTVRLVAHSGALTVTTQGIVKGAAAKGEQVEVENLKSNKTVTGRVLDAGTVEVIF